MKVTYRNDEETMRLVFDMVVEWCIKYDLYFGESICQSDNGNIEAPILLSDIVDDVIQFEVDWEDEI